MTLHQRERIAGQTPEERRRFYSANKPEMIADLRVISNKSFLEKWPVTRQTISHLKNDPLWGLPSQKIGAPPTASSNGLPPMPAFSDQWTEAVQIKWFDTYLALKSKGG